MRAVCGGYRPIRICRSLPRHTSHARPSPRRIAAHKHARGHYLIVPPRRDNVDNIFSWLHQSLMRGIKVVGSTDLLVPIGMASRPQSFQLLFLLLHELLLGVNSKQPLSGLLPAAVSFVTGYQ